MTEAQQVSALVGDIYDAALDPELWPRVLKKGCEFVGGVASNLYSEDSATKTGNIHYTWGVDRHYGRLYYDRYIKYNPFTTAQLFFDVEEIISVGDIVPHEEFRETLFYKEWAQPQGWIDAASAILEKSATSYAAVSVIRHERDGLVDDDARWRMSLLVPHVRRAVLIGKVIELHRAEASTLADALDGLTAGMFLVDATGRIVHANASGHVMIGEAKFVRAAGGRLIASDAEANRTLQDIFAAAECGDEAVGVKGISVPLPARAGDDHVAHVLPLTAGVRRKAGACYAAVAAVFVRKASFDAPSPLEAIAKRHHLTPSELRVLLAIVEIGGAPEVAKALGISETTVKTHLRHIFEKTNTTRQADLVKLVARFASPLVG
ncbi:MAG TPA: helix-turn-helix transcriptional regulator [Xanthobacteraceae bacterium]|nr:helix-turn-helix transcriptional regulator [Xanthobacteraceae bacterium]